MKPPLTAEKQTTITPVLSVRNDSRAVEFCKSAFGAEELFHVEDESGPVVARLPVNCAEFWLADESPEHSRFSPEWLGGRTIQMIMTVCDPDAAFDRTGSAGATVVWPVVDRYGWRLGRIVDPYGHHWEIGKQLDSPAND